MSALTLGLIAALAWGFHDFLVRFITQKVPIAACMITVLVIGLCFQAVLTFATGSFSPLSPEATKVALFAGASFVVANWGLYESFRRGPVWLAAPLVACFSVLSVGWAALTGTQIRIDQWFAVLAVLIGISIVAILTPEPKADAPSFLPTVCFGLLSAVGFASTFAFGQALTELSNEMLSALFTRISATVFLTGVMLVLRLKFWPGTQALWILALMALMDCIAILSVVSAGGRPNPEYAAVATSLYGLPAIWLASTFLKEEVRLVQWAGCLFAFAGIGYLAY